MYHMNSKLEIYMSFQNCFGPIVFLAKPQTSSAYNFNIHYTYIYSRIYNACIPLRAKAQQST